MSDNDTVAKRQASAREAKAAERRRAAAAEREGTRARSIERRGELDRGFPLKGGGLLRADKKGLPKDRPKPTKAEKKAAAKAKAKARAKEDAATIADKKKVREALENE